MKFSFIPNEKNLNKDVVLLELTPESICKHTIKDNIEKLLFGIEKKDEINQRKFFVLCRKIIQVAKSQKIKRLAINPEYFNFPKLDNLDPKTKAQIMAEQFTIAEFEFNKFKKQSKEKTLEEIFVITENLEIKKSFERGYIIGKEVNLCRDLANTPGGDITPKSLAQKAIEACKGTEAKVTIFDEKKIKELGMGAILGVSRGSHEKPRFIIIEYWGRNKNDKPIVLAGKGVTFDSGGLNIKPGDSMNGMHLDMSGGAVAIHTVALASKMKLKINVVALVPAVENMPGGNSYRPGDILKSMSGKTIEVLNTDAEGRLILSDALTYAEKYNPELVVDIATLTGAAVVALGERASAIFTKDKELEDLFRELGEEAGEYVWPLPLWEEYEEDIKGNFADLSNIHKSGSRWGGAIEAAIFLYQFAKKYPWVHIDMAPRMISIKSDYLAQGSTGEPLKLLFKLLEKYSK